MSAAGISPAGRTSTRNVRSSALAHRTGPYACEQLPGGPNPTCADRRFGAAGRLSRSLLFTYRPGSWSGRVDNRCRCPAQPTPSRNRRRPRSPVPLRRPAAGDATPPHLQRHPHHHDDGRVIRLWPCQPRDNGLKLPWCHPPRHAEWARMGRETSGGAGMTGGARGVVVAGVRVGTTNGERPARVGKFAADRTGVVDALGGAGANRRPG